jgi:hypothetical protein
VAKGTAGNGTGSRRRRAGTRAMSDEHKQALAAGRREGAAVKAYLEVLQTARPKRGRRRSPEGIERRLAAITNELAGATPLNRLLLTQERHDLETELEHLRRTDRPTLQALEDAFTTHASSFGERKGIDYQTWREVGVPEAVLRRAGIQRPARRRRSSTEPADGSTAPTSGAARTRKAAKAAINKPARRRTPRTPAEK